MNWFRNVAFIFLEAAGSMSFVVKSEPKKEISVLQFNIWQEGTVINGGFDAIADEIARLEPDFVTLSEVRNYRGTRFCDRVVKALRDRGKTYHSFYSDDTGLLSLHPIIDSAVVYPLCNDHGTVHRMNAIVGGQEFAVYTGHLDYLNDTYYEVRGYDGNSWKLLGKPLTDVDSILYRNALSMRDEAITCFISDSERQLKNGAIVIFGGDFNEPSWLDWIEATCDSADHHGVVIDWPNTKRLHDKGFVDAYRELYPNPVTHPGYTYPTYNDSIPPGKITWAPEADERDRIDYVFYHPAAGKVAVKEAFILGPRDSVVRSKRVTETSADVFVEPLGVWPTDHKAVYVKLVYEK